VQSGSQQVPQLAAHLLGTWWRPSCHHRLGDTAPHRYLLLEYVSSCYRPVSDYGIVLVVLTGYVSLGHKEVFCLSVKLHDWPLRI